MNDLEQFQTDVEIYLASCEADISNPDETPVQCAMIARVRPRTAAEAAGIQTKLQQALSGLQGRNGRKGISIIVGMPEVAEVNSSNRALSGSLSLVIEVHENILVNGGTDGCWPHGAESFALAVAELLSHQVFASFTPLRLKSILPVPEAVVTQKAVYNVTLIADLRRPLKPQVGAPTISQAEDGLVTITCPTAGAVIRWTLDGTYPGRANEAARIYEPSGFRLPPGTHTLRAAASKPGHVGSLVDELTVTVTG